MKKIFLAITAVSLMACNSGANSGGDAHGHDHGDDHHNHTDHHHSEEQVIEASVYDNSSTTIGFGAFKTTDKKEVKGWFTDFDIAGITESKELSEIFRKVTIDIEVASLDTRDEGRNATLITQFFNKTSSNHTITGKVVSWNTDSSTAMLSLIFNDVEKALEFNYTLNGDTLVMQSVLNLQDVNGLEALTSLNTACEALHKGDDGVSKTWTDINVYISTVLKR